MEYNVDERAVLLGRYIAETGATVRDTAGKYGVSKSTVHSDVTARLKRADPALYARVRRVLDINKEERHIRGGMATREKYRAASERLMRDNRTNCRVSLPESPIKHGITEK